MSNQYSISYTFKQDYNEPFFNFTKTNKTVDYLKEIEIIDTLVENIEDYNLANDLIEKCRRK